MEVTVRCPKCRRELQAPEEAIGEKGTCPTCGKKFILTPVVSEPEPAPEPAKKTHVKKKSARYPEEYVPASPSVWRHRLYGVLLLALAPLVWDVTHTGHADFNSQMARSLAKHPEIVDRLTQIYQQKHVIRTRDFFSAIPENRLEGALLPYNTWGHWGIAAGAAVLFLAIVRLMFGPRVTRLLHLFWVAVFTAAVGLLFFVILHYATDWTEGYEMRGDGYIVMFFYLCKFISFSYYASTRHIDFTASFLSFSIGAGLCQELVKALPLFFLYTACVGKPGWRGLALWGMAAGVGFGVAEGINYSREFYNGFSPASDYVLRFVTGVAMQATWTASIGVALFNHERWTRGWSKHKGKLAVALLLVPLLLHGLFATYLNRGMETGALISGAVSFLWLAFQIEWANLVEVHDPVSEPTSDQERTDAGANPSSLLTR